MLNLAPTLMPTPFNRPQATAVFTVAILDSLFDSDWFRGRKRGKLATRARQRAGGVLRRGGSVVLHPESLDICR